MHMRSHTTFKSIKMGTLFHTLDTFEAFLVVSECDTDCEKREKFFLLVMSIKSILFDRCSSRKFESNL